MLDDTQMTDVAAPAPAPAEGGEKEAAADKKKKKTAPKRKGKKKVRQVSRGRAYIQATYNNTIVTVTDENGDVLAWSTAGSNGFRGPKKATPYAASVVIRSLMEKLDGVGLKDVEVFVKGVGQGRESAVRALNANGLNVLSIKDMTPIPHNGCRAPRPRRV